MPWVGPHNTVEELPQSKGQGCMVDAGGGTETLEKPGLQVVVQTTEKKAIPQETEESTHEHFLGILGVVKGP